MKRPLVYIATPYTGQEEHGVQLQMETFHQLMDKGYAPFAPLLCHFLEEHRPRPYQNWLAYCLDIIPRCDALVAFHGSSPGVNAEIECANQHAIPVHLNYFTLDGSFTKNKV